MSTAYFYLTGEGEQLARKLAASHPGDLYDKENFKTNLQEAFHRYDYLVCIMATGIVVRILAPLLVHKTSDPGVVVLDQRGQYAISLLSGHLGGANDLAREMASLSGGEAVITTATDVAGELSFDTFAKNTTWPSKTSGSSNTSAAPSSPDRRSASSQTNITRILSATQRPKPPDIVPHLPTPPGKYKS